MIPQATAEGGSTVNAPEARVYVFKLSPFHFPFISSMFAIISTVKPTMLYDQALVASEMYSENRKRSAT